MGMECSIELTVKLNSGRALVNESVCVWCKDWTIVDKIFEIVGKEKTYDYAEFILKQSELIDLHDTLLSMTKEEAILEVKPYPCEYISANYSRAAEITKILLLRDKKLPVYELFPKEYEHIDYDPSDNVIKTEVKFIFSP